MDYKIKKGRHYANFTIDRLWPFTFGNEIEGTFRFSKECWHARDSIGPTGWNKLLGVSGLRIHNNSGRLVWQPDFDRPGRIQVATYVYDNGVRKIQLMASVNVETTVNYLLMFSGGVWSFCVGEHILGVEGRIPKLKFRAYPFFGGKSKAPRTMKITINRVPRYRL